MTLEYLMRKLDRFETFSDYNRTSPNGFVMGNHQLVPVFDAVDNGLRRFLLAFGTAAGKTHIPVEILRHLKNKKPGTKTLVMAPRQTMMENWTAKHLADNGIRANVHRILDGDTAEIPSSADFVVVNYDKLPERMQYLSQIVTYAEKADLIIADECHNAKNRSGKQSQGLQRIIEASPDARFIALSASPCPNKISDLGMILFMLDPKRYAHYATKPFRIQEDKEAFWEMREKGQMYFFDRDAVKKFYNLPEFTEHDPIPVTFGTEFTQRYFDAFTECFDGEVKEMGRALHSLERVSIEGVIASPQTQAYLRKRLAEGYAINIFSHLRNAEDGKPKDTGIFSQLEVMLKRVGAKNIRLIHGDTPQKEREEIQELMAAGKIDALINQWDCTQEGFSEVAGDRPVMIWPLRSPFAPGQQIQIVGRSYRLGQFGQVEYVEFHPQCNDLTERMERHVRAYAKKNKMHVKSTWTPTLFHQDAYAIRKDKEKKIMVMLTNRAAVLQDDEAGEVDSMRSYAKLLTKTRVLEPENEDYFGKGTRVAIRFVGMDYDEGLHANADALGKDYDRPDIMLHSPGRINLFLARAVEELKGKANETKVPWKIADLGCCASAVFAQSRMTWQALQQASGKKVGLDTIVSVDGHEGLLNCAKAFLERKEWCETVKRLKVAGYDEKTTEHAYELLKKQDLMQRLSFKHANFTRDDFGKDYDLIIASQCLQYNDQSEKRDTERIAININNSLSPEGQAFVVLTGNTFKKSFTSANDVESMMKILDAYGLQVARYAHIQGKSGSKIVLKPFHFIHAIKKYDHAGGLHAQQPQDVQAMYPTYVEVLTGGYKMEDMRPRAAKTSNGDFPMPDDFEDENGKKFVL